LSAVWPGAFRVGGMLQGCSKSSPLRRWFPSATASFSSPRKADGRRQHALPRRDRQQLQSHERDSSKGSELPIETRFSRYLGSFSRLSARERDELFVDRDNQGQPDFPTLSRATSPLSRLGRTRISKKTACPAQHGTAPTPSWVLRRYPDRGRVIDSAVDINHEALKQTSGWLGADGATATNGWTFWAGGTARTFIIRLSR